MTDRLEEIRGMVELGVRAGAWPSPVWRENCVWLLDEVDRLRAHLDPMTDCHEPYCRHAADARRALRQ